MAGSFFPVSENILKKYIKNVGEKRAIYLSCGGAPT